MQIISGARGRITSPFGAENVPGSHVKSHKGMDRGHGNMTPDDLAVYAPADGKVISVAREGTYGYRIIIDHGDGWTSLLAHLAAWTVHEGDVVKQGDLIATMGNTGTIYVHLHQELRYRGTPVNPELYLTESDEIDMLSNEDKQLIREARDEARGLSQRLDGRAADLDQLGKLDGLESRLGSKIEDQGKTLTAIIKREGHSARAYENTDTGEVMVISDEGPWINVLVGDPNPRGYVDNLNADGWCQSWDDRKRYTTDRYEFVKRQYQRMAKGVGPIPEAVSA